MTFFINTEVVHIHTWTWPRYCLGPSAVAHAALPLCPALQRAGGEMEGCRPHHADKAPLEPARKARTPTLLV